jgi:hypothetical protein
MHTHHLVVEQHKDVEVGVLAGSSDPLEGLKRKVRDRLEQSQGRREREITSTHKHT